VSIPLGNSGPRASYKSGKATLKQVLLQLKQLEQNILVTVDNDVGQVRSTLQQVDATARRAFMPRTPSPPNRRNWRMAKAPASGLATHFNLTTARSSEIQALANYNIALAQLALDEGSTLEKDRVDLKVK